MQNGHMTDFANNFKYQVFFKTYFPSCLIVNTIATFLLVYNITKLSSSFLPLASIKRAKQLLRTFRRKFDHLNCLIPHQNNSKS